jgi:hypothetical protein
MPVIDLQQVHKTVCKYCGGKPKQSLVPANFVCGACKKFCEQQLSGEELDKRSLKIQGMLLESTKIINNQNVREFLTRIQTMLTTGQPVSNQQYLSVCRILRKVK